MQSILRPLARLIAALLALLALPALSQPAAVSAAAAIPAVRPALWKVSDGDTTIYLFGTIHALPRGIAWFGGSVASAFEASSELVTEIVPPDPALMQGLVISKAMLPKGSSLRGLMRAADKASYEAALTGMGMPVSAFDAYEPWYAAVGISTLPLMNEGFTSANGVEETLNARAKQRGIGHGALETAEYQLSLFDTLPMDVQSRYLTDVVGNLPEMKAQVLSMIEAWKVGDADHLARLINQEEDDPALLEVLLTNRNRAWAQWIRQRLDKPGTVFMAVGAGHLAGTGSVQDQLAAHRIDSVRVQ